MHDLLFLQGYLHAQDRFFQMDYNRHLASGTLTEIVGPAALPTDVQPRSFGLRRGAEAYLSDIRNTVALRLYQAAGAAAGFDGTKLFFQDLFRSTPFGSRSGDDRMAVSYRLAQPLLPEP